MTPTEADGGSSPTDTDLQRFTDEQRRADAADARRREHWLRHQAGEEGTFAGVLVDLAERNRLLAVQTRAGRTLRGAVRTLGTDFVGLSGVAGDSTLIPLTAVTSVRPEPDSIESLGDRTVTVAASFDLTIAELAADRRRVSVHTTGGDHHAGLLWGVGRDLLVLRTDDAGSVYLRLAALNDVVMAW